MIPTPALTDSKMPLADFLETHKAGITLAVTSAYPPRVTERGELPPLLRSPMGRQHEAITALALSLNEHRNTLAVGEMGVGKCVAPETLVTANGEVLSIAEVWSRYAQNVTYDGCGYVGQPSAPLSVPSLDETDGKIKLRPVGNLWRQQVREPIRQLRLADGCTIRTTKTHAFFTPSGWRNDLKVGDYPLCQNANCRSFLIVS